MKKYILPLIIIILLASCGASRNYLERTDEDKALSDAARRLEKNPDDVKALEAVPLLYKSLKAAHLAKIKSYEASRDISRWDNIIAEYQDLQHAYDAILSSTGAFKLVNPQNFNTQLLETKEAAAADYYNIAATLNTNTTRENAKKAYTLYGKINKLVPGYKNASALQQQAYENAVITVVINPVQDDSYFFNSGWGNTGYNYSNEYFQQNLVRELQNTNNSSRYAARFYSDWEARRQNIKPDWVVDLRLRDMSIPYPQTYSQTRQASAQIPIGTDTSGHTFYKTVYATVYITQSSFTARANMEVSIRDLQTNRNVSYRTFSDSYRWEQESGSYTGDSRALSSSDWAAINNRNASYEPRKEDLLNELYRSIYPQVKNNITYSVDW